ncbi:MAG: ComF family protein [Zoogloeaceae bacterium]|nr:ComF family protein [Zoogloeaceae bacterium]
MSILAEKLEGFRNALINAVLPQDCLLCASPSGSELLCADCLADLPQLPVTCCPRCALPSPLGEICGRCQRHPPAFDALIAAFPYAFPIDRMIQRFKYGQQLALAGWFGRQLAACCNRYIQSPTPAQQMFDLIIPMPLHKNRLAERGFNQAMEISRQLSHDLAVPIANHICTRTRDTAPQEGLSLKERRRNLKAAFACNTDLRGKHVLLVDDVVTTGASIGECARTLRLHGAAHITVATVARTLLD